MIPEFLIGRLGEYSHFAGVSGEMALGLKDGIRGDLSRIVHGDSAASGQGVALVGTCHDQQLVGHRSLDNASAPGGEDETHQHRALVACHLARDSGGLADLVPLVALPHRDYGELVQDDGPAYGSGYLLVVLSSQTDKSVVVPHGDRCLESSLLASTGLLLHGHNLQNLIVEEYPQEKVIDLRFLDG